MPPLRQAWEIVQEPRVITAATTAAWLMLVATGVVALTYPPATIAHTAGPVVTSAWAWMLLVGGVLGAAGCLPGWWWVERSGIIATITALGTYLVVVLSITYPPEAPGTGVVQAGLLASMLTVLVVRWLRVSGAQVDPARLPRRHRRRR